MGEKIQLLRIKLEYLYSIKIYIQITKYFPTLCLEFYIYIIISISKRTFLNLSHCHFSTDWYEY